MEEKSAVEEILDVIENSNLKISEKLHLMGCFFDRDKEMVRETRFKLVEDYRYCPFCNEWYLKDSWIKEYDDLDLKEGHRCPVGHYFDYPLAEW